MKKLICLTLMIVMAWSLCACGSRSDNSNSASAQAAVETPQAAVESPSGKLSKSVLIPKPTAKLIPEDGLKSEGKLHVYIVGEGEKINTPDSSVIDYLKYFSKSKHLIICMKGKDYVFANVSSSLWSDFKTADSVDNFYNQNIKSRKNYHVNDYDGTNGNLIVLDYMD